VIDVLYFSDRRVKEKLLARVRAARRLTLITGIPPHRAVKDPAGLEPFASLETSFAGALDQVLVVDEGSVEGMWRDPLGDLADSLFPHDRKAAYAAARGYCVVRDGAHVATLKKSGDGRGDVERLEKAIERLSLRRPAAEDPGRTLEDEPPDEAYDTSETPAGPDPYAVLGIAESATLAEAKKAWRALIVQYHPDKVAHLAPEFRELADRKTRELMEAWERIQASRAG
jgi:hypothetical protein